MQKLEELISILIEKTEKKELCWKREEHSRNYKFTLRFNNSYLSVIPKGKNLASIECYSYRHDTMVFNTQISRKLYSFLENWWNQEVIPPVLEFYIKEISSMKDSPMDRIVDNPIHAHVGAAGGMVEGPEDEDAWPEAEPPQNGQVVVQGIPVNGLQRDPG